MAAAGRALEGEFRADVQAQFRLVVNAYERYLASLNDGEPAGRCYLLAAPGTRDGLRFNRGQISLYRPGTAPRWRNSCSLGQYPPGSRGLPKTTGPKMANPGTQSESARAHAGQLTPPLAWRPMQDRR